MGKYAYINPLNHQVGVLMCDGEILKTNTKLHVVDYMCGKYARVKKAGKGNYKMYLVDRKDLISESENKRFFA